jgi:hypothetical protein
VSRLAAGRIRVRRLTGDDSSAWPSGRVPGPALSSGSDANAGRDCGPVVEAADVGDAIASHGEDLPALSAPPAACVADVPVA